MDTGTAPETAKRVRFLSFVLGVAGGVALVAIALSVYLRSPILLVPAIALAITTIPLMRSIGRLRKAPDRSV